MRKDSEFEAAYSESSFWEKIKKFAGSAGKDVVEKALLLFYAMQEEKAPAWAKATIAGALGYFIVPLDAVADITPGIGFTDDLGVLVLALAAVAAYINDDVKDKAAKKMYDWFGEPDFDYSARTTAEGEDDVVSVQTEGTARPTKNE